MKKILYVFITVLFLFFLVALASSGDFNSLNKGPGKQEDQQLKKLNINIMDGNSRPQQDPEGLKSAKTNDSPCYIWMDYYKLREGRYIIRILQDGSSQYFKIVLNQIVEVREGMLSPNEAMSLFDLLYKKDFFTMKSRNPHEEKGIIYEGDIVSITVDVHGRHHSVSGRLPDYLPINLLDIIQTIEKNIPKLQKVKKLGTFLSVVEVNQERVDLIKKIKQRESQGARLSFLSALDLDQYPSIKEAVANIGQLIYVDPTQSLEIESSLEKYDFILLNDKYYELSEVFSVKEE